MRTRIATTLIALLLGASMILPAGVAGQDNSGIGQYTETPPTAGGGDSPGSTGSDPTGSGTAGTVPGASGVAAGTGSEAAEGTVEASASGVGEVGPNRPGELPRTGADTGVLAALGVLLLLAGLALRRRLASS